MRPEHEAILILLEPPRALRREKQLIRLLRGRFDWAYFVKLADEKLIASFLYYQLRKHELLDLVAQPAASQLRDIYETVATRNSILLHDLRVAGETLDRAGIEWIPLKGAALLSHSIYPEIGLRVLSDLDILVRTEESQRAFDKLLSLGYRKMSESEPDARHLHPLVNSRSTMIEIHKGIGNRIDVHIPVDFDTFRDSFLPSLHWHLSVHQDRDAKLLLRGQIDLWYLNQAMVRMGVSMLEGPRPFGNRGELVRALQVSSRYDEVLYTHPDGWWRLAFPRRKEMVRRHGAAAQGLGLYPLYGRRLLSLRGKLPAALRRGVAGYIDKVRFG
jgi:hypothetical protein